MIAPCGLDCWNCPVYLARDDEGLRAKISQNTDIPVERVNCRGCRAENGTIPFNNMTEPCKVYRCTGEKSLSFCYECPDFPCDRLHPYADMASQVPHNTKVFNLCLIKKMGLESWAETRAKGVKSTYSKGQFKI